MELTGAAHLTRESFNYTNTQMNITEAAQLIGIATPTASRLCRDNHIAAFKGPRGWEIPKSSIEEYIAARRYERANDRMKKKMEKGQI